MFEFISEDHDTIRHIPSGVVVKILLNPVDGVDYDAYDDAYEDATFRGNYIVALWINEDDYEAPDDYSYYRAIFRKAIKYYRAHTYIEKYVKPDGIFEDDQYVLAAADRGGWICTDKINMISIFWEDKQFNESQEIININDFTREQISTLPTILRKMADWLVINHSSKL